MCYFLGSAWLLVFGSSPDGLVKGLAFRAIASVAAAVAQSAIACAVAARMSLSLRSAESRSSSDAPPILYANDTVARTAAELGAI